MSWINENTTVNDIVINSSVRLYRNIKGQRFTDKSSLEIAKNNITKIQEIVSEEIEEQDFKLIKLREYESNYSRSLIEKRIISKKLLDRKEKSAVLINNQETLSIMINEEEHLVINCVLAGLKLKEEYDIVNRIDDIIENKIRYEFHSRFGYLTASPNLIGTSMKAQAVLHLPALKIKKNLEKIAMNLNNQGLAINIMYDDRNKDYSSIYILSNKITLGMNEEEIIKKVQDAIDYLIKQEKAARKDLLENKKYELEDRVYRAEAILSSAKLLDSKEILELLSDVRLGTDMSMLEIDKSKLNELLINTRDCVIENNIGNNVDTKKILIERAKIVKEILNN